MKTLKQKQKQNKAKQTKIKKTKRKNKTSSLNYIHDINILLWYIFTNIHTIL